MNASDDVVRIYMEKLPKELFRRWGQQKTFSVEQIATAADAIGVTTEFIAYAHATFCSRADFDAHYPSPPAVGRYEELRAVIKERYSRNLGVDAAVMIMLMG